MVRVESYMYLKSKWAKYTATIMLLALPVRCAAFRIVLNGSYLSHTSYMYDTPVNSLYTCKLLAMVTNEQLPCHLPTCVLYHPLLTL